MSTLSPLAISSSLARETGEVFLILLEISHSSLIKPHYLVNNTENIVSGGNTYTAYPFDIQLQDENDESLGTVKLIIDNVDRSLVALIRQMSEPPSFVIKLVLSSQPDIVEITISDLKLRECSYNRYTIEGELYSDDILSTRFPESTIDATQYLGLF